MKMPEKPAIETPASTCLRRYALETLRADLCGIANVERFLHAPPRMSPAGIMPSARSVVVMAVHHPDACIELGGRTHPQEIGPYRVQYRMNQRLDEMSFRLANHLQSLGHEAVAVFSSNSWRYRSYKEMPEVFAPDLSHMHAAVAAGLAEFGFSGLAISPEFGARNRWITVLTDAALTPTPLLEPGSVCDHCMLCRKHCMSGALSKEVDGWNEVRIEDKVYRYARKNLWRCAWGEHFDLDLDLDLPETVTPETIEEARARHGLRGGEMGSCLRYCLPAARRYRDPAYTDAPRRRRDVVPGETPPGRAIAWRLAGLAEGRGADGLAVVPLAAGEMDAHLPGAVRGVTVVLRLPGTPMPRRDEMAGRILAQAAYDITRELERNGHDAICETDHDEARFAAEIEAGVPILTQTVLTTAPLEPTAARLPAPARVRAGLEDLRREADRVAEGFFSGVASAGVLDDVAAQLRPHWAGQRDLAARDRQGFENRFLPMDPAVTEQAVDVRGPGERWPGAASVLVLGLPLPRESVACTGRPPAEAPGPLSLAEYESQVLLLLAAWRVAARLEAAGHRAWVSHDLLGTGSGTANSRGTQPDWFCNRFAAVAAGLGRLGRCGHVVHPVHGSNLRTVSIVTDAPLPVSGPADDAVRPDCEGCSRCLEVCPVGAFREPVTVAVGSATETFHPIERVRCDWSKRHGLVAEEGPGLLGWQLDVRPPEDVTAEALEEALRKLPAIERARPCAFEACVLACPHTR